jgi:hypothetical protein
LPDTLELPLGPLVTVTVKGEEKIFPYQENYKNNSVLYWLKDPQKKSDPQPAKPNDLDQVQTTIDRLITDDQPMIVLTRIKITVSGRDREEVIDRVLLPNSRPTQLVSPLPTRLVDQGLRIQAKPGIHEIFLTARLSGPVEALGPLEGAHGPENWAVNLNPALRQVDISGAPQIDASQVNLPRNWRNFPIYALEPGQTLTFKTLRRGDPEPGPNLLTLNRSCWLDYDGQGLACRDDLSGQMRRDWRVSADPPFVLGQASLNGQPQVLTWQINSQGQKSPGLQVRQGSFNVTADLRLADFQGLLPASGWDHNLQSADQKLNLPPGYRLFHVSGARAANDRGRPITWVDRWNALDLFIVLAIFLAALKLKGRAFAILALAVLILSYHELMSPRLVILHIFGAVALLKVLPAGLPRVVTKVWFGLAALFLLLTTVVFLIHQARIAMYPQLEDVSAYQPGSFGYPMSEALYQRPWTVGPAASPGYDDYREDGYREPAPVAPMADSANEFMEPEARKDMALMGALPEVGKPAVGKGASANKSLSQSRAAEISQSSLARPNPEAVAQNSLARPKWSWQSVVLDFNGQVARDQEVKIYLLTPKVVFASRLLKIALMAIFALKLLGLTRGLKPARPHPAPKPAPSGGATTVTAIILALFLTLTISQPVAAQSWPDQEILDDFKFRLLKSPDNEIRPAWTYLGLEPSAETLKLTFRVEATVPTIMELPVLDESLFQPVSLKKTDKSGPETGEANLPILAVDLNKAYVLVPAGLNSFVYEGRLKKTDNFQLRLPDDFKPKKVELLSPDWELNGLDPQGAPFGPALYLSTKASLAPPDTSKEPEPEPEPDQSVDQVLEPYFSVMRTISLGLEWKVINHIILTTTIDRPVTLRLPLLPGERPLSTKYQAQDGYVVLNFSKSTKNITFESDLNKDALKGQLILEAKEGLYSETWILDASTLWRVEPQGLTPMVNVSPSGYWNPQWRPWPGEKLTINITKPEPVPGSYQVIDEAQLLVNLGEQNRKNELTFKLRSSKGGQHSFRLPKGSEVQLLTVNHRSLPISSSQAAQGPEVNFPFDPGFHEVSVSWLSPEPLKTLTETPQLDLGLPVANIEIKVATPVNRFVFWAKGPTQGPAVLFWSIAGALLIVSLILSRGKLTPLGPISWFLLFLGLAQLSLGSASVVAIWLLLLGLRGQRNTIKSPGLFNLAQIGLALWTLMAFQMIYQGLKHGLLEAPSMGVTGNSSSDSLLIWFQDRTPGPMPEAWCLTLSNTVYHYIMLAWALWLAISTIRWLIWGWKCYSAKTLWKTPPPLPKAPGKPKNNPSPPKPEDDSAPTPANESEANRPDRADPPDPNQPDNEDPSS